MDNNTLKRKTTLVIIVTFVMMVAEIYFGIITNSMGLTADGVHMGTHVIAFAITLLVCMVAIRHQDKAEKLNALGGYTSAILLGFTGLGIIYESVERFINPLAITFGDAILVAVIGLIVNLLCMVIMGGKEAHNHCVCDCEAAEEEHEHSDENLNFKAAYLHIAADALTSVLAIVALILGKHFGWVFLDPAIGILGGLIIGKWSVDLLMSSARILLDFDK